MRIKYGLIAAGLVVIAYQVWKMYGKQSPKGGYCLGGAWIPAGAGKPFIRDGKMYYCPNGGDCGESAVEVDIDNADKRCL